MSLSTFSPVTEFQKFQKRFFFLKHPFIIVFFLKILLVWVAILLLFINKWKVERATLAAVSRLMIGSSGLGPLMLLLGFMNNT